MIVRDVEAIVAKYTGALRRNMEQRSDKLRAKGYLPKGGHGPYAPKATPEHAANVLIAYFGTTRAANANETMPTIAELTPATKAGETMPALAELIWRKELPSGLYRQDFRTALAELLGNPRLAAMCREIWICRDVPFAEIRPKKGTIAAEKDGEMRFYAIGDTKISDDDGWPWNGLEFVRIPGALIRDLAKALAANAAAEGAA